MKIIRLDDVQIFVRTADAGSFSEAARQLNIAPGLARFEAKARKGPEYPLVHPLHAQHATLQSLL